jgi:carboxyl-terminal processing protease
VGSGTSLKYTIGKRYLPDDTNIDHEGIKPDIEVLFDKDAYTQSSRDVQREKALDVLKGKIR